MFYDLNYASCCCITEPSRGVTAVLVLGAGEEARSAGCRQLSQCHHSGSSSLRTRTWPGIIIIIQQVPLASTSNRRRFEIGGSCYRIDKSFYLFVIFLQKTSVYPSFKRGLDGGCVRTSVPDDLTTAAAEVTHSCHHASISRAGRDGVGPVSSAAPQTYNT